ncbi:unnamed protein product [Rhizophagus irregularis]|uniref:Uncharacterized protein n=1 Tax=Rhizophagus irregularis TaxID=588596 RepID=A0A2N1NHK4_9GLOM|nr:hypothetical protein RhiirC2_740892 [Rhizophagus irregularis]CAB4382439.1 unnamed protein product [Rhizophagus irregularis]CAB5377188.1 unnamed protein product [Rhizophagus irregularis]
MFVKKISTNSSLNQIFTRNAKLITNKKTNINNLLFGNNIRQSSSSQEETSHISRGQIDNITDVNRPPPGLDASIIKNAARDKENQEARKEYDPDDAPTTVDSQAPAASESAKPAQIFDPKENKFIDANSASKEYQGKPDENESDSGGKKIGDKYDDVIAELPSEQGSG